MARLKSRQRSTQKRSFLLLELLLSLALIALCLFPMIKPHSAMRKDDALYLERIQLDLLSQRAYCSLKEQLYENKEHSWKKLDTAKGELPDTFRVVTGEESAEIYKCQYVLHKLDEAKKPSLKKKGLVVKATLCFCSLTRPNKEIFFERTLYLERHSL